MSENHIRNVIEAALLAGGKPLQVAEIAQLFDEDGRPDKEQIVEGLRALETEYADRGIELKETASGWRVQIRTAYGREIGRLWPERGLPRQLQLWLSSQIPSFPSRCGAPAPRPKGRPGLCRLDKSR